MPFFFSERLPVPALKSYIILSSFIFVTSLIYGKDSIYRQILSGTSSSYYKAYLVEPFCLWALVNMAYCGLFIFGKVIQNYVLGQLRHNEQQHLQDKFWNFIFYKIIFIFGVINAHSLNEVLCWTAWFSMLGFLHIFGQLCKDRYEYVTSSPATPAHKHVKLVTLIFCIFLSSIGLSIFAICFVYQKAGLNIFSFMIAECMLLGTKSLHVIFRYTLQLCDLHQTGLWDRKAKVLYYTDLSMESIILSLDLMYHFHMLIWSNVFISMASLVLYWNIRTIFSEMKKRITKHRNYKNILKNVEERFQLATEEELEFFADHCAICWDNMETARKLPCSHLFHHACLCSWLQQDVSCPTCRQSLTIDIGIGRQHENDDNNMNGQDIQEINANTRSDNLGGLRNYFFYLDGQQIANWFPSFSIEVFHGRQDNSGQNLNDMGEQLFNFFPHISRDVILEDLRHTNSVDATADNILEGNLMTNTQIESDSFVSSSDVESQNTTEAGCTHKGLSVTDVSIEQTSDIESFNEDSSGTEDPSSVSCPQESDSEAHQKVVLTKVINHSEVRRRYLTKSASNQADVSVVDQQCTTQSLCSSKNEKERWDNISQHNE